ncbi:MAG TPA: hypothetical protein VFA29_14415 [Candidatus Baltobacteraceae bacterium]|nr:hypothetical protein [Candidatus Baltobacteraceae bacterium]
MIFQWLSNLPVAAGAPLFIGAVVALAVGGGILFHRLVPNDALVEHNEIAGFVFAVVGVIYAVLLAFLAVGVWEHLQTAEARTYEEAARLTVVYRKCDAFPEARSIRASLRAYVAEILNRDWPMMQHGQLDDRVVTMGEQIAAQIRHLPVRTPAEQNVHSSMIGSMDEALVDRDSREAISNTGLGGFLWAILIAGAMLTIVFSYLFAYRNAWSLIAIVGLLSAMVGLVLYLVAAVDYPFRGEIRVGPEAFEHALAVFSAIGP